MSSPRRTPAGSQRLHPAVIIVTVIAALALLIAAAVLMTRQPSSKSASPSPSASSPTVQGPRQNGQASATVAPSPLPDTSSSSASVNPMASLSPGDYNDAVAAADGFMKAWATRYGSPAARTTALSEYATRQLAQLSGSTDETLLPDPSKIGKGTIDKEHSTQATPVVAYTVGDTSYWVLLQHPGESDSNASGEWVVSQNLDERAWRGNYEHIKPQP